MEKIRDIITTQEGTEENISKERLPSSVPHLYKMLWRVIYTGTDSSLDEGMRRKDTAVSAKVTGNWETLRRQDPMALIKCCLGKSAALKALRIIVKTVLDPMREPITEKTWGGT